jgi:hypothetical protein
LEVKGAVLLYTLATLAITFAGFAALLLIVRQLAGGSLTALDRFLTRTVVGHCVWITAGALIPPVLGLFELQEPLLWKASALLFGLPMLAMLLTFQRRRVAATGHGAPPIILGVMIGLGSLSLVAMIAFILAGFAHPAAAYAAALLVNFLALAFGFFVALEVILRQSADGKP